MPDGALHPERVRKIQARGGRPSGPSLTGAAGTCNRHHARWVRRRVSGTPRMQSHGGLVPGPERVAVARGPGGYASGAWAMQI
jgi:hypothetical protein